MTNAVLHANTGEATTPRRPSTVPAGIETTRRDIIIASTTSGAHYLRTYMPVCSVRNCAGAGHVELVSRMDNRAQVFCLDHGLDHLDALDYGKRGVA